MDEKITQQLNALEKRMNSLEKSPVLPDHFHNGFDVSRINFTDVYQKRVWVHHTIVGTMASTAGNYGVFFIVPFVCVLTKFQEVHQTLGTDAGAVTVDLEKLTGTTAPDSGSVMLSSALSLKATINSVQTGSLTTTNANLNLAVGDRLCLKDIGVLTAVANVTVSVELLLT